MDNGIKWKTMEYKRHPTITALQDIYKGSFFSLCGIENVDAIREIKSFNKKITS